jgi:hypothetical protein
VELDGSQAGQLAYVGMGWDVFDLKSIIYIPSPTPEKQKLSTHFFASVRKLALAVEERADL